MGRWQRVNRFVRLVLALAMVLVAACGPTASAEPSTASPTPYEPPLLAHAVTPAPTPTLVPTAKPILYRPRDFILAPEDFPLVGYKVTEDQENSAGGVRWEGAWTGGGGARGVG